MKELKLFIEQQLVDGSRQTERFLELHKHMRLDASSEAAKAVLALLHH